MPVLFDEMFTADQQVRAHYQPFYDWLKQQPDNFMASKREEADLIFRRWASPLRCTATTPAPSG